MRRGVSPICVAFGAYLWATYGAEIGQQYHASYLIEKSLAVDNVFVWAIIFTFFGVPRQYQHRVLFLGVLGALVFRALFISLGAVLIDNFSWILYIFGVTKEPLIVFTANAFAILGLRAMYFLLADLLHRFVYLKLGLAFVLIWVGITMLLLDVYKIPTTVSPGVVALIITISVVTSLRATRGQVRHAIEVENASPFRLAHEVKLAEVEPLWRWSASHVAVAAHEEPDQRADELGEHHKRAPP